MNAIEQKLLDSVGGMERLASMFSMRTMRDTVERARREVSSAADAIVNMQGRILAAMEREGYETPPADIESATERYIKLWAAYQHAGARTANAMVTGPANFPAARNRKRIDTEMKRLHELLSFAKQAPALTVKRARLARQRELGADGMAAEELEDLKQRHARKVQTQEMMKTVNKLIRKHKLTIEGDGPATLSKLATEAGYPAMNRAAAMAVLKPDFMGKTGFPSFALSNGSAEIRRLAKRIDQVGAKLERMDAVATGDLENRVQVFGAVEQVENFAEDRLQFLFPGKPSAETRRVLKSNGFRWSPSQGAWQRKLTNNARWAAKQVVQDLALA